MNVTSGPFTERTAMLLLTMTRLANEPPGVTAPPRSYTPLVTQTSRPGILSILSTAFWIVCLAVAHEPPSFASFPFSAST